MDLVDVFLARVNSLSGEQRWIVPIEMRPQINEWMTTTDK